MANVNPNLSLLERCSEALMEAAEEDEEEDEEVEGDDEEKESKHFKARTKMLGTMTVFGALYKKDLVAESMILGMCREHDPYPYA